MTGYADYEGTYNDCLCMSVKHHGIINDVEVWCPCCIVHLVGACNIKINECACNVFSPLLCCSFYHTSSMIHTWLSWLGKSSCLGNLSLLFSIPHVSLALLQFCCIIKIEKIFVSLQSSKSEAIFF